MDLYILDRNFDAVAVIDTYKSMIWTDRFQECGDFELYTAANREIFQILKPDYYIWRQDSEHTMIVEEIKIESDVEDGNYSTVTGRSLESLLDRRVIWGQKVLNGNFQEAVKTLLYECIINPTKPERKISNFVFEASDDPKITGLSIDTQYTGDNLYDVICDLCVERGIGFKITLNARKQFVFKLYSGTDRSYDQTKNPYVVFSPNFDNIINSTYLESKSDYKNVTLVAGEGEGSARRYTAVGNVSGISRRETFTDARDLSSDTQEDITEKFDFTQFPNQVYQVGSGFVSNPYFDSCRVDLSAYPGRTLRIEIPQYTNANGEKSNFATVLVTTSGTYISVVKAWDKSGDTANSGSLESYEFVLPDDIQSIYTSMFSQQAISAGIFTGSDYDAFECSTIKLSSEEYIAQLRQRGKETLSENSEQTSFEGEAETTVMFRYGEHFFNGDIVQIEDEYGHETKARVLEIITSEDEKGRSVYPTFSTVITDASSYLPDGYVQLWYIESSGTQFIDTNFIPDSNTMVTIDLTPTKEIQNDWFFGVRTAANADSYGLMGINGNSIRSWFGNASNDLAGLNLMQGMKIVKNQNVTTIEFDDGSVKTIANTDIDFQCEYSLYLLNINLAGTPASAAISAKVYGAKVYNNGSLVQDYIPCATDTGEIGMYDIVNRVFHGNAGTGVFGSD